MREAQPTTIYLKDYTPPPFLIDRVALDIDIRADDALVKATLSVRRHGPSGAPLVLDGDELELVSLLLDQKSKKYEVTAGTLTIHDVPDAFTLETVSRIVPQKNTKLEGLYATQCGFVTQCEAQGFRRITWFIDRPDNLATLHGHSSCRCGEVPDLAFEWEFGFFWKRAKQQTLGADSRIRFPSRAICLRWWRPILNLSKKK